MRIALPRASSYSFSQQSVHRTPFTILSRIFPFFRLAKSETTSKWANMAARPTNQEFVREDLEDLMKRRFFVARSFDIYGGVAGLYDLGVPLSHLSTSTDS